MRFSQPHASRSGLADHGRLDSAGRCMSEPQDFGLNQRGSFFLVIQPNECVNR